MEGLSINSIVSFILSACLFAISIFIVCKQRKKEKTDTAAFHMIEDIMLIHTNEDIKIESQITEIDDK